MCYYLHFQSFLTILQTRVRYSGQDTPPHVPMETITIQDEILNNNNTSKIYKKSKNVLQRLKPQLQFVLYLSSYFIFVLLILAYLFSKVYKIIVKILLRGRTGSYSILPASDACWANEGEHSPSNIVLKLELSKKNGSFFPHFNQKVSHVLINHRTGEEQTFKKLGWIIKEKFGVYVYDEGEINGLDLGGHVYHVQNCDVKKLCENHLGNRLPKSRPQWRIYFVENDNANFLLFVFHHCYGDGISWVNFITTLLDPEPGVEYYVNPFVGEGNKIPLWKTLVSTPHHFSNQLKRILTEGNQFHGKFAENEKVLSEFELDLVTIKGICKGEKITFTEFIENRVKSGFLKAFDFDKIPSELLTISPYAKIPYCSYQPVNQFYPCFSLIKFDVEKNNTGNSDTVKECNLLISELIGSLIAPMQRMVAFCGAKGTMAYSNLPAFKGNVCICGEDIKNFYFTPPIKFRTGISLGLVGVGGKVCGSLGVDKYVVEGGWRGERWVGGFCHGDDVGDGWIRKDG